MAAAARAATVDRELTPTVAGPHDAGVATRSDARASHAEHAASFNG